MYYKDTWPRTIPDNKLMAYKRLIDSGEIRNQHVTVYRNKTKIIQIVVEYDADEGIREKLKSAISTIGGDEIV